MATHLRIKLDGESAEAWQVELEEALRVSGVLGEIKLSSARPPDGLRAADPAVVAAIVSGSFSVLTTLITCAVTIYSARRQQSKQVSTKSIQVVLRGTKDSLHFDASSNDLDQVLQSAVMQVGELREVLLREE